jgi:hypothetical protein
MGGRLRRVLVVAAATALLTGASPVAAEAHTRTQETTNVTSTITHAPDLDGVSWTMHTGGLLIEVEHRGTGTLIVEGYDGEPYLRITPEGVEHNRRSAATYLNAERYSTVTLPPAVDPDAPPDWVHVSDEPHMLWHDHRTHWMSPQPPGFVDTGPLARTLMRMELVGPVGTAGADQGPFTEWEVPLHHDGQATALRGQLEWHDPPPAWPWLALAALLVASGLLGLRRDDPTTRVRAAALMVGGVAAVNGIHLVDDVVAFPAALLDELFGLLHTSFFLALGLGGAAWAWFSDHGRRLALGIAGGAVLYHQGLVHLPMLGASDFPTVWPDGLVRLTVGLGALQAVVVVAVLFATRRPQDPTGPSSDEPSGPSAATREPAGAHPS